MPAALTVCLSSANLSPFDFPRQLSFTQPFFSPPDELSSGAPPPPPTPPPPWFSCGGVDCPFYKLPTEWSAEDDALLTGAAINLAAAVLALLLFWAISRARTLRVVYAPLHTIHSHAEEAPWAPRTWLKQLRAFRLLSTRGDDVLEEHQQLEQVMLLRFVRMNLRLFLLFSLIALPVMLPIYAVAPNLLDGPSVDWKIAPPSPPPLPNQPPPSAPPPPRPPVLSPLPPFRPPLPTSPRPAPPTPPGCQKPSYGVLETLTLAHVPPRSPRLWAPFWAMVLLTLLFLGLLRLEWQKYVSLRHAFLSTRRPEAYSLLLRDASLARSDGALHAALAERLPLQVHCVLRLSTRPRAPLLRTDSSSDILDLLRNPFSRRRPATELAAASASPSASACRSCDGDARGEAAATAASARSWRERSAAVLGAATACAHRARTVCDAATRVLYGEQRRPFSIVLVRSRRTAALCAQLHLSRDLETWRAPAPADVCWANVHAPRLWVRVSRGASVAAITLLFLFWGSIVAVVQSLVSLDSLEAILLEWNPEAPSPLGVLSPTQRATVEGWVSTISLASLQAVVLYSGLLNLLSRLMGYRSYTEIGVSTMAKFWSFNFLLILIGSSLVGALINTVDDVLQEGLCFLIVSLGRAVPNQANFFFSYILQDLFLIIPLLDVLQLLPLLLFCLQRLLQRYIPRRTNLPALLQKLQLAYLYARMSLLVNIGLLFSCFAPLAALLLSAWLAAIQGVWAHNCEHVLRPIQGAGFDSGGAYWPSATRYQSYAIATSQFVLAAFLALNAMYVAALLTALVLLPFTLSSSRSLEAHYGPIAKELPLDICDALDALDTAVAGGDDELSPFLVDASEQYSRSLLTQLSSVPDGSSYAADDNWRIPVSCTPLRCSSCPRGAGASGVEAAMASAPQRDAQQSRPLALSFDEENSQRIRV